MSCYVGISIRYTCNYDLFNTIKLERCLSPIVPFLLPVFTEDLDACMND